MKWCCSTRECLAAPSNPLAVLLLVRWQSKAYRHAIKTFGEVLDSADELTLEEQENLVSVLQRRVTERRRAELIRDVKEARQEFKAGKVRPATVAEILKRIA